MAKQFSPALLGHEIEGIWHTGVVVYGTEYFYGGGIQAGKPGGTQAGRPMKIHDLGVTYIPQSVFMDFLHEISSQFTPEKYSLLKHNCNNFSDEVSMFLLGEHIPSYITGLPEFAFSTPMGQMLKPMIEQFEAQMKSEMGGVPIVPWSESSVGSSSANSSGTSSSKAIVDESRIESKDQPNHAVTEGEVLSVKVVDDVKEQKANGTANNALAAQAAAVLASVALASASQSVSSTASAEPIEEDLPPVIADVSALKVISPNSRPFLSLDNQKHPKVYLEAISSKTVAAGICDKKSLDSLQSCVTYLVSTNSNAPLPLGGLQTLNNAIKSWPTAHLFGVLSLLRLLASKPAIAQLYLTSQKSIVLTMLGRCIPGLSQSDSGSKNCSMSARLMSICVIANLLGHAALSRTLAVEKDVIEAALTCLDDKQKFMRLIGANIALNCSLLLRKAKDSDFVLELVTRVSHTVSKEDDVEVYQRLLLALGHLILFHSEAAIALQAMTEEQFKSSEKTEAVVADINYIMNNLV
eukprot:TRINITY_DN18204_c0_g1_i1.p1 TRINITY_DN18204_c0_g1~~TRINITY_DN18204_c0_g1_i1.p1  ORF type:complete len:555 (-),score=141.21 TRINITY_DN18204_c0_g1_i1:26-1594(-)